MKRKFDHPAPSERALNGPRYWRSLDELAETPGFKSALEREFPEGSSNIDGVDRRQFMKIMAASFALGGIGLAGCRRPEVEILPFGKSVEGVIPGLPLYYATAMPIRGGAIPLLAETHQGRPTKLEGNPAYAAHGGSTSLLAQASLLDLYDPDRATQHMNHGAVIDTSAAKELLSKIGEANAKNQGEGLAFLAESSTSLTRTRLLRSLKHRFPKATWAEFEPVNEEASRRAALAAFGTPNVKPIYRFARAKRIVSIDADFLKSEAGSLYYAREFSKGRRVTKKDDPMNRLYMAESVFTLTGGMADHRLRLASSHMLAFAGALAGQVTGNAAFTALGAGLDVKAGWIAECAADLNDHKGESIVIAGSHLPAEVQALAYAINAYLGNIGKTIDGMVGAASSAANLGALAQVIKAGTVKTLFILGGNPVYNAPADLDWASLQKSVPEVIRFGYYSDETSELAGTHLAAAHYLESWGDTRTFDGTFVPVQPMIQPLFGGLTELEILAVLSGTPPDKADPYDLVYATVSGANHSSYGETVFRRFLHDGQMARSTYRVIPAGYYTPAFTSRTMAGVEKFLSKPAALPALSRNNLEVRFLADHKVDDGRYINNGWLQECPDPITKLTWDNAILVSPKLAKELGIDPKAALLQVARKDLAEFDRGRENAPILELTVGGRKLKGPAHIQPGLSDYTIALSLGYGRTKTGRVGTGAGFNAYAVRGSVYGPDLPKPPVKGAPEPAPGPDVWQGSAEIVTGASVVVTGERMLVADSQWHWSMEGRDLVREANYDEYQENPSYVKEEGLEAESPPIVGTDDPSALTPQQKATEIPRGNSLYKTPKFDGVHQWGMSIDLNTCIGCNACVIACQAENNIPIVGKDQVLRGRIMHWIRIDRYYSDGKADAAAFGGEGNLEIPEDPQVSLQPVACMQCELAPCETVCPVNATVHDPEGLNVMAYNRCVGTRYCANNCPYKVRRFNFFDWNKRQLDSLYLGPLGPKGMPELVEMGKNPEVTMRMRGVMEKCTYCVQRIENGKIQWKVKSAQAGHPENVVVPDGVIKTACQQACPAEAIVFGNILDTGSAVSQAKSREQDYGLLAYLNTRPRTTYLGKLRNPNKRMPDYSELPLSRIENFNKNHPSKA